MGFLSIAGNNKQRDLVQGDVDGSGWQLKKHATPASSLCRQSAGDYQTFGAA